MQLAENTVVAGRFRLNRLIGRGGMGSVWHATHLGLDIPCAVKFIEGEMASLPEAQSRFEREAKAAAQLRSPHVVQILDHGICDSTPYIAMELLDGEDLGKRLQKVGRLAPSELHTIMNQVCRALGKAHALGIVHRDLKPDNIFLVRDDDREIAKVLDFGIAKSRLTSDLTGSNTKTGAMLGTPYYMSPEQAQGTKAVDFRSDLWSLAVIAFQALTGRLPFESEALGDLLVKIIVAPVPVPSQYGQVPPGFDRWWMKAASREVADRFQSAKEFSDSLALVCGVSHVSGVVDRHQIRVAAQTDRNAAGAPNASSGAAPNVPYAPGGAGGQVATPAYGQYPAPYPSPPMGQTPPHGAPAPAGYAVHGTTPMPAVGQGVPPAATPAPMSRTFGQSATPADIPKKGPGPVVWAAIGVFGAITLASLGYLAFHGKGGGTSAGNGADTSSASADTNSPPAQADTTAVPPATGDTRAAVDPGVPSASASATAQAAVENPPGAGQPSGSSGSGSSGTGSSGSGSSGRSGSSGGSRGKSGGSQQPSKKPFNAGF